MAISPIRSGGFIQKSRENRTQRNLTNFGIRTGQRFPDIARGRLLEQTLVAEQEDKQQQARTALAFRTQEENERQARTRESEAEQGRIAARRERKKEEKFDFVKVTATVVSAFT